ncbi:hypothetical protein SGRA_0302 [Saprospira grandis str. Lewin]|uniref:Transmembrane protein n=1 Tax=Saprospira grandis (strain Lewin) TaxID=984262 RepID=H6L7K9_SAPGL|nr:hypothetical protein SGRA_0302 [Saprospira grandis str. Lewin]
MSSFFKRFPKLSENKQFGKSRPFFRISFFGAAPALRLGRAMAQLAVRSALRFFSLRSKKLGLAFGHCYLSLSRSSNFFLWAFFFGGFAAVVVFLATKMFSIFQPMAIK